MNWKVKTQVPRSNLQVQSQNIFLGYEKKKELQKTSVIVGFNL